MQSISFDPPLHYADSKVKEFAGFTIKKIVQIAMKIIASSALAVGGGLLFGAGFGVFAWPLALAGGVCLAAGGILFFVANEFIDYGDPKVLKKHQEQIHLEWIAAKRLLKDSLFFIPQPMVDKVESVHGQNNVPLVFSQEDFQQSVIESGERMDFASCLRFYEKVMKKYDKSMPVPKEQMQEVLQGKFVEETDSHLRWALVEKYQSACKQFGIQAQLPLSQGPRTKEAARKCVREMEQAFEIFASCSGHVALWESIYSYLKAMRQIEESARQNPRVKNAFNTLKQAQAAAAAIKGNTRISFDNNTYTDRLENDYLSALKAARSPTRHIDETKSEAERRYLGALQEAYQEYQSRCKGAKMAYTCAAQGSQV